MGSGYDADGSLNYKSKDNDKPYTDRVRTKGTRAAQFRAADDGADATHTGRARVGRR